MLTIVCAVNTLAGWLLLRETYAPVILSRRKKKLESDEDDSNKYTYTGEDFRPMWKRILRSFTRPLRILLQPIVLTMSSYQAIIFATTYSIYTSMYTLSCTWLETFANLPSNCRHATNLPRRVWLQYRTSGSALSWTWARVSYLRLVSRSTNRYRLECPRSPEWWQGPARIPPTSGQHRLHIYPNCIVLVRMDGPLPSPLVCLNIVNLLLRHRSSHDTEHNYELLHRQL